MTNNDVYFGHFDEGDPAQALGDESVVNALSRVLRRHHVQPNLSEACVTCSDIVVPFADAVEDATQATKLRDALRRHFGPGLKIGAQNPQLVTVPRTRARPHLQSAILAALVSLAALFVFVVRP